MLLLGCTGFESDNLVVYNRLYDICCVNVISDKTTVGYFDMDSKVTFNENLLDLEPADGMQNLTGYNREEEGPIEAGETRRKV